MIVTLTDFGDSEYLGAMKGAVYSLNQKALISDLCNSIPSGDILAGAWALFSSYDHFPKNTVFLCVVDPSVGTNRKPLLIKTKNYYFVGPDNGLLHPAAYRDGIVSVHSINFDGDSVSKTFHGRDIFAIAAAKFELGTKIEDLGVKTDVDNKFLFHLKGREGTVVRIDSFGNIITNIPHLSNRSYLMTHGGKEQKLNYFPAYNDADDKNLFLIEGTANTLEISLKNSNASKKFNVKVGDKIRIE